MSMRNSTERTTTDDGGNNNNNNASQEYRSIDKTATLPRRYSVESSPSKYANKDGDAENEIKTYAIDEECPGHYSPYNIKPDSSNEEDHYMTPKKSTRAMRSMSLREHKSNYLNPKAFSRSNSNSVSERNDDSLSPYKSDDYSPKPYSPDYSLSIPRPSAFSYSSSYSPDSSTLSKYLTPNKYGGETQRSISPIYADSEKKTELKKPSTVSNRRISRFLRPDFYEKPKEENVLLKEKKEREMETQKVLKEIRDKRKGRLNMRRERSTSREEPGGSVSDTGVTKYNTLRNKSERQEPQKESNEGTDNLLNNVSATIKNIESNVKLGDYVNVARVPEEKATTKKERVSKLIRPKSYPAESSLKKESSVPKEEKPEKETKSKISRLRKGFASPNSKVKESPPKETSNSDKTSNKNRFLHSIEKKFEKLRSFSSSPNSTEEKKNKEEKKSSVENAIKQLREQSLPRNLDHCITESCLIKRAVSVEDLATLGAVGTTTERELQPSRKSVTKILGLFKKYEEKDKKVSKLKKPKEIKPKETVKKDEPQMKKNTSKNDNASKNLPQKSKIPGTIDSTSNKSNPENPPAMQQKKLERPRSLLYDHVKQFQNQHGKNDNVAAANDASSTKASKLPLNGFRRSLNLDNSQIPEPPKFYKQPSKNNINEVQNLCNNLKCENNNNPISLKLNGTDINDNNETKKPDRRNLKLDLYKVSSPQTNVDPTPSTSASENQEYSRDNRNSLTTTDDSSVFLSPCDDNMSCDSWSVCSDFHTQDLLSPISPNGHVYSGDENESVIDRIRRKSFYTRFNEKKRPRKSSLSGNYRDLDYNQRKSGSYRLPGDYGSLDRRSCDYRDRKLGGYSSIPDSSKKDYRQYGRNSSLLNDYVNLPNRYQTFNPRMNRHISSLYSPDIEDGSSTVDDNLSTEKSRKNSYRYQPSSLHNRASSVSPCNDKSYGDTSPLNQNSMNTINAQTST